MRLMQGTDSEPSRTRLAMSSKKVWISKSKFQTSDLKDAKSEQKSQLTAKKEGEKKFAHSWTISVALLVDKRRKMMPLSYW